MAALPGKLMGVTVNGTYINCQIEATLTLTNNLTENTGCKPAPGDTYLTPATITRTVDSRDWEISYSAKAFADSVTLNQSDIAALMLAGGNPNVEVTFQTTATSDYDFDETFVYEGPGIIQDLTINAPQDGEGTHDGTIVANGDLTLTRVPVST